MAAKYVLDASAVLAFLQDEAGGEEVARHIDMSLISTVNLAEVVGKLIEKGSDPEDAVQAALNLTSQTVDFDLALGLQAGRLRRETRAAGLSLGDRACLALAEREGLPALTTDTAWNRLGPGFNVVQAR